MLVLEAERKPARWGHSYCVPQPAHDGFRLHEDEHLGPPRPAATQRDPEPAINGGDARLAAASQHGDLLTQGEVLQYEIGTATKRRSDNLEQQRKTRAMTCERLRRRCENVNLPPKDEFWRGTRGARAGAPLAELAVVAARAVDRLPPRRRSRHRGRGVRAERAGMVEPPVRAPAKPARNESRTDGQLHSPSGSRKLIGSA